MQPATRLISLARTPHSPRFQSRPAAPRKSPVHRAPPERRQPGPITLPACCRRSSTKVSSAKNTRRPTRSTAPMERPQAKSGPTGPPPFRPRPGTPTARSTTSTITASPAKPTPTTTSSMPTISRSARRTRTARLRPGPTAAPERNRSSSTTALSAAGTHHPTRSMAQTARRRAKSGPMGLLQSRPRPGIATARSPTSITMPLLVSPTPTTT